MAELTLAQAVELAYQLVRAGKSSEAEILCGQILAVDARQPDTLHLLGVIAGQAGRFAVAENMIRKAIAISPKRADFYSNLGSFLQGQGRYADAVACYENAIAVNPEFAEALNNMAAGLLELGRAEEALSFARRALAARPNFANALNNLGNALRDTKQLDAAIDAYRRCVALDPNFAQGYNNLGTVLFDQRRLDESVATYQRSLSLDPNYAQAHCNLATALRLMNRLDEAVAEYETAIGLDPNLAMAHNNLGVTLLLRGEFARGWREHEWRWRMKEPPSPVRHFPQPQWDGSSPAGRTILIHCEQGWGDSIQFVRYVPLVAELGARVVLECPRPIYRLMQSVRGVSEIAITDEPLPRFDLHCPLLTLPLLFKTDLNTIPADVPYLRPDPVEIEQWKARLSAIDRDPIKATVKIGLTWAGNPNQQFDRERSLAVSALAPLAEAAGVRFISLQQGAGASQTPDAPAGLNLIDWTSELANFADAALVAALDLVITVDTATAHLAGALGKPVWVLLPYVPDWRWMLNRDDSPWYPTMRLFRQPAAGEWGGVIERVKGELRSVT